MAFRWAVHSAAFTLFSKQRVIFSTFSAMIRGMQANLHATTRKEAEP